jgi:flagellar biosynthesis protein FliR
MITFNSAEIAGWIALLFYPLVRVLGFFATAPLFSNIATPVRVRLVIAIAVTFGVLPLVPPLPPIDLNSGVGLWMLARELGVGIAMGFAMRIVFAALLIAGEQIGMQMGLGSAVFYSPQNAAQVPIISEYLTLLATLVFLSINGHLMMIATLAQSFQAIPIGAAALPPNAWSNMVLFGGKVFSAGLLFALPVTVALVITNLALGVLTRAAPQLNLFAIGFPITMVSGFAVLALSLAYFAPPLQALFEEALHMMLGFVPGVR